jgi:hypothetical protein
VNILCLTCGKKFTNEQDAIDHNAYFLKLEQETIGGHPDQVVRRHWVEIIHTAGVAHS